MNTTYCKINTNKFMHKEVLFTFIAFYAALICLPAAAQKGPPSVPVEAITVKIGKLSERITTVGTLGSNESVVIRPEIAGRITEINFQEGQKVTKGASLIVLDSSVYRAELDQAKAQLQLANRNYARIQRLVAKSVATEQALDEAKSKLEIGNATVALAQAKLDKTAIKAPFSGITGLRKVSVGDYITVGQDIVNLEDIETIKVDFRVAEKYLPVVKTGQNIQINVDAYQDQTFEGQVYAVDPRINLEGRSVVIRARVPNKKDLLRPGLFARVKLIMNVKDDAIMVPEQAIIPKGVDQYLFRIVDNKAKFTKVVTGIRRDGNVEIIKGLKADDIIVTAGHQKIRDGVPVKIVNSEKGV